MLNPSRLIKKKKSHNKNSTTRHNKIDIHMDWDLKTIYKYKSDKKNLKHKTRNLYTLFSRYLLFCKATQAHRNQQSPRIPCFTCTSCRLFENNRGVEQMS